MRRITGCLPCGQRPGDWPGCLGPRHPRHHPWCSDLDVDLGHTGSSGVCPWAYVAQNTGFGAPWGSQFLSWLLPRTLSLGWDGAARGPGAICGSGTALGRRKCSGQGALGNPAWSVHRPGGSGQKCGRPAGASSPLSWPLCLGSFLQTAVVGMGPHHLPGTCSIIPELSGDHQRGAQAACVHAFVHLCASAHPYVCPSLLAYLSPGESDWSDRHPPGLVVGTPPSPRP